METKREAEIAARRSVNKTSWLNGSIAWVPFSTLPLTLSEGLLVRRIGRFFNVEADDQDVSSVLAMAAGATIGHVAGEAAKTAGLVFLHIPIAASMAKGIGEIAISYFRDKSSLPDA